jgi:hypothetical protein
MCYWNRNLTGDEASIEPVQPGLTALAALALKHTAVVLCWLNAAPTSPSAPAKVLRLDASILDTQPTQANRSNSARGAAEGTHQAK